MTAMLRRMLFKRLKNHGKIRRILEC